MKILLLITIIASIGCVGCRSVDKMVTNQTTITDSVIIERRHIDTLVVTAPDAATLDALWECDSLGNVLMAEIDMLQGERLKIKPNIKYVYVTDEQGQVRRKAYMSVLAQMDSVCHLLNISEEKITKLTKENNNLEKKIEKKNAFNYVIIAFILILLLIYLFRDVAKRRE